MQSNFEKVLLEFNAVLKNRETVKVYPKEYYIKKFSFLKNIVGIMPGFVYMLNYQTMQYLYMGTGTENVLGYTADEFMKNGHLWTMDLLHPDDLKELTGNTFQQYIAYFQTLNKEQ
jgi:hypothetical protein